MKTLDLPLKISLVLFMVGNLLDMGLRLKLHEAIRALRNVRFVTQCLLWGFILLPGLAYLLTVVVPLAAPYAIGLLLLGLAPCAPFLPPMVDKAHGDIGHTAAFMLLTSVATVAYMPLAVPLLVKGFSAGAWTIAKPLLFFLLVPMAIGMAIQFRSASAASKLQPIVKKATGVDTLLMLVLCVVIYGKAFLGLVGSYAIGAQILFFSVASVGPYLLSFGLPRGQKIVLSLGMCTRNIGAALAPLFAVPGVDQRAIVMVSFGVLMQAAFAIATASYFGRRAKIAERGVAPTVVPMADPRE
jgi:bile acid:Na+ symporter, BASS family